MILITSDLHWNNKTRDQYRHDYVDTIAREVKKNGVDRLFILGDLTDDKDHHGAWLVNKVFYHVYRLSQICPVAVLKGNHDYLDPSVPFFGCLGLLENVTWMNDPMTPGWIDGLFLPHTNNYQKDWGRFDIKSFKRVFTHNTFKGAKSESGQKLDGIPPSVFSKKQMVISGDIHLPQEVGPIEYVGSPYPIDFGDDLDKHMILLDYKGNIRYIEYEGPRKILLDLSLGDPFHVDGLEKGDILKVRVNINADEFAKFQEYKDQIKRYLEGQDCVVHMVQPVFDRGGPVQTRRRLRKKSDEEVLEAYAKATKVKKPVVKTGLRLMSKA
jgi:DNA repair exonuclease SbcCD nuclease subunit